MAAVTLTIDTTMHKASMAQRTAIQVAKMDEKLAGKSSILYSITPEYRYRLAFTSLRKSIQSPQKPFIPTWPAENVGLAVELLRSRLLSCPAIQWPVSHGWVSTK